MGFLSSIKPKELDLSTISQADILEMIHSQKIKASTSLLGERRVSFVGKEGVAKYSVLAQKVHEILAEDVKNVDSKNYIDRVKSRRIIEGVQSLHTPGIIRAIIDLIGRLFGFNQSLRDIETDRKTFGSFTQENWDKYFPGQKGKTVQINKEDRIQASDAQFKQAETESILKDFKQKQKNWSESREELVKENQRLKDDNQRLKDSNKQLESCNQDLERELGSSNSGPIITSLKGKNKSLTTQNTQQEEAIKSLNRQNRKQEEALESRNTQIDSLQKELEVAKGQLRLLVEAKESENAIASLMKNGGIVSW